MRKKTVRSGLRGIAAGILCVMATTFFHDELSSLLFLGMDARARLTFLGFLLGGILGGGGVLLAAAGLMQTGTKEAPLRLAPTVLLLISLVILFFVLAYNSITAPHAPKLPPGESVNV